MATLTITSNGLPNPAAFGNAFGNNVFTPNVNTAQAQTYNFSIVYRGGENTVNAQATVPLTPIGIANNGVVLYNPSVGPTIIPPGLDPNTDAPGDGFEYNAVQFRSNYGADDAGGWPETTGQYHYNSSLFMFLPTGSAESAAAWSSTMLSGATPTPTYYTGTNFGGVNFRHADGHSKIIGYCFDGYPIYGPYSYSDPTNVLSSVIRMTSSYQYYTTEPTGRGYTWAEKAAGTFINDHEYQVSTGTLDEYNGRYSKTPDYPNGTWAYYVSVDSSLQPVYPYIFGNSTRQQRSV